MASRERRRRKRRSDGYRAPVTRRASRERAVEEEIASRPAPRRVSRRDPSGRPPSPWGAFPLVEIVILVSIILLVVGFLVGGTRGGVMLVAGVALGSLAALELTLREHFSGYRSHTSVLAGFVTVIVLGLGFFLDWPQGVKVGAGIAAFVVSFYLFREAFKRRSGGLGFR